MGVSVHVDIMANLISRRALCYGISALIRLGCQHDLNQVRLGYQHALNQVEMDGAYRLLDVVYDGF